MMRQGRINQALAWAAGFRRGRAPVTAKAGDWLRTRYTDEWEARKDELQPFPLQAARATQDGVWNIGAGPAAGFDVARDCMPTGQSAGGIASVQPCGDIVAGIMAQAEAVLCGLPEPS